jgi:hypothetical protein
MEFVSRSYLGLGDNVHSLNHNTIVGDLYRLDRSDWHALGSLVLALNLAGLHKHVGTRQGRSVRTSSRSDLDGRLISPGGARLLNRNVFGRSVGLNPNDLDTRLQVTTSNLLQS